MINYDSFLRCHLRTSFFAFHAGAKELNQKKRLLHKQNTKQSRLEGKGHKQMLNARSTAVEIVLQSRDI